VDRDRPPQQVRTGAVEQDQRIDAVEGGPAADVDQVQRGAAVPFQLGDQTVGDQARRLPRRPLL